MMINLKPVTGAFVVGLFSILAIIRNFLFIFSFLHAQSYLIHTYTEFDGLPSTFIKDIAQDSSGNIWFASRGGITSYDGVEWRTYSVSDGLPVSDFYAIKVDKQGKIWALTKMAKLIVWYFDGSLWIPISTPETLNDTRESITSFDLATINNQTVLAIGSTISGLHIYSDNRWKQITEKNGLLSSSVNAITFNNRRLYIATNKGLSIMMGDTLYNKQPQTLGIPSPKIIGIAIENVKGGSNKVNSYPLIWLAGEHWLGFLTEHTFQLIADSIKALMTPNIFGETLVIEPDYKSGLFFGNPMDLFYINRRDKLLRRIGEKNGLTNDGATAILRDREDNLWIAGVRGVSKISSMRFANFRQMNGLLEDEVTAVLEVKQGTIVFGHNSGLTFFDGNNFHTRAFSTEEIGTKAGTRVMDLRTDPRENIWAAVSDLGLAKITSSGEISWFGEEQGLTGRIISVLVDNNDIVWVGGQNGLFSLQGEKFNLVGSDVVQLSGIRRLFEGTDHSLCIATVQKGVFILKNNRWKQYLSPQCSACNSIYTILEDSRGRIWVGSLGGLLVVKNEILFKFDANGFQIDRPVFLIVEDPKGRLWFGTDNGVIRWDGEKAREFTIRQGLAGQETNRAAGIIDQQGRVWIGTNRGVSCYLEEFDQQYRPPPIVEILPLRVSGEELLSQSSYKLKYNRNDLTFPYRAVTFIDENQVLIRRILRGFDKEWITEPRGKRNLIRYSHLPPGRYRFYLQARNADGVWSETISSSEIYIRKPFWNEWWFYLIITLIGGAVVYGIQAYISEKRYSVRLGKEVNERTKQLQKSEQYARERFEELEKWRKLTVGRELKMIELKEKIKELRQQLDKS